MAVARAAHDLPRVGEDPGDDAGDDAYAAPTKVGAMSHALIAKMMSDADAAPAHPPSGLRPKIEADIARASEEIALVRDDEIAIVDGEDEEGLDEPTLVHERAAPPAMQLARAALSVPRTPDGIVERLVAEALTQRPRADEPLVVHGTQIMAPAAFSGPVAWAPGSDAPSRSRRDLYVAIAIGVLSFLVPTSIAFYFLFS